MSDALKENSLDARFLELLRCPRTGSRLRLADPAELDRMNRRLTMRRIENLNFEQVEGCVDGALINEEESFVYPIYERTPYLMSTNAIEWASLWEGESDE